MDIASENIEKIIKQGYECFFKLISKHRQNGSLGWIQKQKGSINQNALKKLKVSVTKKITGTNDCMGEF